MKCINKYMKMASPWNDMEEMPERKSKHNFEIARIVQFKIEKGKFFP